MLTLGVGMRARAADLRVTTLAGPLGGPGYADGVGTAAQFSLPEGIASDGGANLYVSDYRNHTIRRVDLATGLVSTLAGKPGFPGALDGSTGSAARFDCPVGIALDGQGNLYVVDANRSTVRKVVLGTGQVATTAGLAGQWGSSDGAGTAARFKMPRGVASDGLGNLYVADSGNSTIRKVAVPTGEVTTIAGLAGQTGSADGVASTARFKDPRGVVLDGPDALYVTDSGNHTLRRLVLSTGQVTTVAGAAGQLGTADGVGGAARFNWPIGVDSDRAGRLYVADMHGSTIREVVLSTNQVTTFAGSAGNTGSADGFGTAARFFWPTALTVSGDGTLYVADGWNSTVREVLLSSARVTTVAGSGLEIGSADGAGTAARFAYPRGLALDGSGTLYVGDNGNHTVRKVVVATGEVTTLAGAAGQSGSTDGAGSAARFACPSALVFDGSGSLFVSDRCNHTIRKVALSTALVTTVAGSAGSAGSDDGTGSAARFNDLEGLALDGMGNLFVADAGNHTIRIVVLSSREVTTLAGAPGTAGSADGTGTAARFNDPRGLAFDESGTLYVTDSVNDTLRAVVPSTAQVSTVAGTAGQSGSVDGAGTTARFWRPWAVASDGQGALFVSDSSNHTLRRIELATGLVTTIAGIPRGQGDVDGVAELARFSSPVALAVAPDGRLLATEIGGHRVRSARPIDSPTRYHALPPCRVLDTRGPGPPVAGNPLTAGASRVLRVIGTCSVPATAWAVSSNVTVVAPSSAGFLTIWPTGYPMPVASTVNFRAGQVRANNALLTLGTNGSVSVHAGLEPGKVDLILDVTGWFE